MRRIASVTSSLSERWTGGTFAAFGLALARNRLRSLRPARHPARVTFLEGIRISGAKHNLFRDRWRLDISWVLITALVLGAMAEGTGVAYPADGSSPGSVLYGLDTAMESLRYNLASSPETKPSLALASAEERLAELAAVAAGGEEARAKALAQLLQSLPFGPLAGAQRGQGARARIGAAVLRSGHRNFGGRQTDRRLDPHRRYAGRPARGRSGWPSFGGSGWQRFRGRPAGRGPGGYTTGYLASVEERLAGLDGRIA